MTPPPHTTHTTQRIDHYLHFGSPTSSGATTNATTVLLNQLLAQGVQIMATLQDLQAEVATIKQDLADAVTRIADHESAEDAANAALQTQVTDLTTANAALQTEIDALKAAGVDTTALDAIMADLQGVQTGIEAIDAAPPAPPAGGGETPVP